MAFDRKTGGFGGNKGSGGFRSGGGRPPFRKPGFGGPRRDDSRPAQMYPATCANCGAATEVPFRPDGSRPIYCKDCMAKREPLRRDVAPRRDFGAGREAPRFERRDRDAAPRSFAPRAAAPDARIEALTRDIASLSAKLDGIASQLAQMTTPTKFVAQKEILAAPAKKTAAVPKKGAKKAAKKSTKKAAKK